jgi:hypothetical protein
VPNNNSTETYAGWPNRETWGFMLYVNNEQSWQEEVYSLAIEAEELYDFEQELLAWWEVLADELTLSRDADDVKILRDIGSDWRIDWRHCAANIWEDTTEQRAARMAEESEDA